jgi:hypothetical protein
MSHFGNPVEATSSYWQSYGRRRDLGWLRGLGAAVTRNRHDGVLFQHLSQPVEQAFRMFLDVASEQEYPDPGGCYRPPFCDISCRGTLGRRSGVPYPSIGSPYNWRCRR